MKKKMMFLLVGVLLIIAACANNDNGDSKSSLGDYPSKTIEVYVGHGAGGGTDLFARAAAKELEELLGVKVNVVNMEGGAGVVAAENAHKQSPDGYTLVADAAFPITTAAGTNQYGLEGFTPIARFQSDTYALWVDPDKFEDIDDFMEQAKANPNSITVGGTGSMGMDEITVGMINMEADVDLKFIPMEGAGEMHAGLVGGHIDAMVEEFGPADSLYQDESIKPLVVFNDERLDEYPDLPTTVENGWDLVDGNERGFYIHSDADPELIEFLEETMKEAYDSDTYQKYQEDSFLHLREGWMDSEEFTKRTEELIEKFEEVIQNIGD